MAAAGKQQLAVLSLALAAGACVSAFRLIDALLFRTEASPYPLSSRPSQTDGGGRDVHLTFNPQQFAIGYMQRQSLNRGNCPSVFSIPGLM